MVYGEPGVFFFEGTDDSPKGQLFRFGQWPASVALSESEQTKLRELTLISLCETRSGVAYSEVASVLGLSPRKVEPFLLQALLDGAIDGQLDAQNEIVRVRDTAVRNASAADIAAARTK